MLDKAPVPALVLLKPSESVGLSQGRLLGLLVQGLAHVFVTEPAASVANKAAANRVTRCCGFIGLSLGLEAIELLARVVAGDCQRAATTPRLLLSSSSLDSRAITAVVWA